MDRADFFNTTREGFQASRVYTISQTVYDNFIATCKVHVGLLEA